MTVKQISVFIENSPGKLLDFTQLLDDNNINMNTLSIAETKDFGIVRFVTDDSYKTVSVLRDASYIVQMTDVIVAEVENKPGSLNKVLKLLSESQVNIQYAYTFTISKNGKAYIVFKTSDLDKTLSVISDNGIKTMTNDELNNI